MQILQERLLIKARGKENGLMHARLSFGAEIDQLARASLLWNVCSHMKPLQSSSISASLRFWHAFASASCLGRAGRARSTGLDVIGKHGASVPRGALTGSARTALEQYGLGLGA